jgi:hypothetical protein
MCEINPCSPKEKGKKRGEEKKEKNWGGGRGACAFPLSVEPVTLHYYCTGLELFHHLRSRSSFLALRQAEL